MITSEPKFINSPFFIEEKGNWHLKPNAPEEIVQEFNEYMGLADENGFEKQNIEEK